MDIDRWRQRRDLFWPRQYHSRTPDRRSCRTRSLARGDGLSRRRRSGAEGAVSPHQINLIPPRLARVENDLSLTKIADRYLRREIVCRSRLTRATEQDIDDG